MDELNPESAAEGSLGQIRSSPPSPRLRRIGESWKEEKRKKREARSLKPPYPKKFIKSIKPHHQRREVLTTLTILTSLTILTMHLTIQNKLPTFSKKIPIKKLNSSKSRSRRVSNDESKLNYLTLIPLLSFNI